MDVVCEELVAQRSKLHERESKGGGFHGGKSFKPISVQRTWKRCISCDRQRMESYYANGEHDAQDS